MEIIANSIYIGVSIVIISLFASVGIIIIKEALKDR